MEAIEETKAITKSDKMREIARQRFTTHGETKTHLYRIWAKMIQRCYDKKSSSYKYYGNKNIVVCEEWKNNFLAFKNWAIQNGYKEEKLPNGINKWTIDRIDNNKGYYPDNCRWVTQKTQCNNQTTNRIIEYNGEKYTMAQLAEFAGLKYTTLEMRIDKYKWDLKRAIETPVKRLQTSQSAN